jgi:hypothetical protein
MRRTTSGAAGYGLSTTIKYPRGAAGNDLGTTIGEFESLVDPSAFFSRPFIRENVFFCSAKCNEKLYLLGTASRPVHNPNFF